MGSVKEQLGLGQIDWRRVGRRTMLAALVVIGSIELYRYALGGSYGFDFRGGAWKAGWDVLHGLNPYPAPDPALLRPPQHAFFTPPLLAVVAIPLSILPFAPAVALWNLCCVGAFVAALRVLGIDDRRWYVLALCSIPLIDSLESGQPDALFALAAAVAWRYRNHDRGAMAVGALIAAKLVAWPLAVWLLVTRRTRSFFVAVASALLLLGLSWACIGFKGLIQYPRLLAADAHAVEGWRFVYSLTHVLLSAGMSVRIAGPLTILIAVAVGVGIARLSRGTDHGWFTAMLMVGLLASPILWLHYLVLLFIPLAIAPTRSLGRAALAGCGFWLLLVAVPPGGFRALAVCALAGAIAILSIRPARRSASSCAGVDHGPALAKVSA